MLTRTPDEVRQAPGHVEAGTSGTPNHPNMPSLELL